MSSLELSPSVFSILSGLVEEKAGLHYGLLDKDLLREKASSRALEAGFDSLLDYYYFIRYDQAGEQELSELIDALVVNETYFFREWAAIQLIVEAFIEPWCQEGRRPRIWSSACATGEEPLSLAMLLDEKKLLDKVEIVASDISVRALNRAKSARFGKRSIRLVPPQNLCDRYLVSDENGYKIADRLVHSIHWERQNLLKPDDFKRLGHFDIILCRNVLIYFADKTVRSVLDSLANSLNSHGLLLVGVSESLLRFGSRFNGEEHNGAFVYRKTGSP